MADRIFHLEKLPDEGEFTGASGPTGVGRRKRAGSGGGLFQPGENSLSAAEKARLLRMTGHLDPLKPRNQRIWTGQSERRTPEQVEGDRRNDTGNTGP